MKFELVKKVPIVEIDGKKCFVDTGRSCDVEKVGLGIQRFFGIPELYVAGTNWLKRFTKFNYSNSEITTSDDPVLLEGGETVSLVRRRGWLVNMTVGGVEGMYYIDTGAAFSYVNNLSTQFPMVEVADECGWTKGHFKVPVRRVPCEFAGHPFEILCGDANDNPEYVPPEGVIGYDFFNNFTVAVDRDDRKMTFVKN